MKKLEEYKIFPVIAWVLVVGFAGYTFTLAFSLQASSGELAHDNNQYVESVLQNFNNF